MFILLLVPPVNLSEFQRTRWERILFVFLTVPCCAPVLAEVENRKLLQPPHSRFLLSFQYVLAVGSSVFGAMFYGDLAEGESEIHIPDVEPAAFLILLK